MNYLFCGLPKSGKTTLGKRLAEKLKWDFIDTDRLLEQREGLPCREIYRRQGERAFRLIEREEIASLQGRTRSIIALGGGSVGDNLELLSSLGTIIYLKIDLTLLWARIQREGMPAFLEAKDPKKNFYELAESRLPIYEAAAHFTLEVGEWKPEEILHNLLHQRKALNWH